MSKRNLQSFLHMQPMELMKDKFLLSLFSLIENKWWPMHKMFTPFVKAVNLESLYIGTYRMALIMW